MEQQRSTKDGHFKHLTILVSTLLFISTSCIGIRMNSDIDLGGGYYYVQDYPQCICQYPKPGKVVLPIGDKEEIVVKVQYNESIIIAVCSPYYYSTDSTVYKIEKRTGEITYIENDMTEIEKDDYKEIKNHRRYKNR